MKEKNSQRETSVLSLGANYRRVCLEKAAALLRAGEVVAFPTETVYGLGADALNASACAKIFLAKGRPADNPLIVHIGTTEQTRQLCRDIPASVHLLAERFWPGPLTVVLPKKPNVPTAVTGGLDTVGIRIPSHPAALALLRDYDLMLAAPSANRSGRPSPTTAAHVLEDLDGRIPLILDGGRCEVGLESTVLDLTGAPVILRPGAVTREELSAVLGEAVGLSEDVPTAPKSPGLKYRHYAPQGQLVLLRGDPPTVRRQIVERLSSVLGKRTAVLALDETLFLLDTARLARAALVYPMGSERAPAQAAARLYDALRLCDSEDIEVILLQEVAAEGIGVAVLNRMRKAAD